MADLDAFRGDIAHVTALLEDAIDAALVGQAPEANAVDIAQSVGAVRERIEAAARTLRGIEERLSSEPHFDKRPD